MKKVILILGFGAATVFANAQTVRYVKQGGTGNGTSWAAASGNIQSMIDTVYARGGGDVRVIEVNNNIHKFIKN